jgi:hypothetical protein
VAEVASGSSYYSQSDFRLHFGLGTATKVETVALAWPSGLRQEVRDLPVDHAFVVREGDGVVSRRAFK